MATKTWIKNGATGDWTGSSNWAPAGAPVTGDSVVFGRSGRADCRINTNPIMQNLDITKGFTGSIRAGTSTLWIRGSWRCTGSGKRFYAGTSTIITGVSGATAGSGEINVGDISNEFNKLLLRGHFDARSDIRISSTGAGPILTVDQDSTWHLHPGVGEYYNVYIRGTGDVLRLKGQFRADLAGDGNGGIVNFELAQNGKAIHLPTGIGFGTNGAYTAAAIRGILVGAITGEILLKGPMDGIDNFQVYGTSTGGHFNFRTNNFNVEVYSFFVCGGGNSATGDAPGTWYFGSSNISVPVFLRFNNNAGIFYLQSANFVAGLWSIYGPDTGAVDTPQIFYPGTSIVRVTTSVGEVWQYPNFPVDAKFYSLILNNATSLIHVYNEITQADSIEVVDDSEVHCEAAVNTDELIASANIADIQISFNPNESYRVGLWTLSGTNPYVVILTSGTPGAPWIILTDIVATADHVEVTDSHMRGAYVDVSDGTSVDGGNNTENWVFTLGSCQVIWKIGRAHV